MSCKQALIAMILVALSVATYAQTLTPEGYVRADLAAREATVEGMTRRLEQITQGQPLNAQFAAGETARMRVAEAFARFGTSGASHAAYGSRHRDEVAAWLEQHPTLKLRYQALDTRFKMVSERLDALRSGM